LLAHHVRCRNRHGQPVQGCFSRCSGLTATNIQRLACVFFRSAYTLAHRSLLSYAFRFTSRPAQGRLAFDRTLWVAAVLASARRFRSIKPGASSRVLIQQLKRLALCPTGRFYSNGVRPAAFSNRLHQARCQLGVVVRPRRLVAHGTHRRTLTFDGQDRPPFSALDRGCASSEILPTLRNFGHRFGGCSRAQQKCSRPQFPLAPAGNQPPNHRAADRWCVLRVTSVPTRQVSSCTRNAMGDLGRRAAEQEYLPSYQSRPTGLLASR